MTLPKNALTTNPPARFARRVYRSRLRPVARDLRIALRTAGPMDRSNVPGFLLIGAQKAGTTGLYEALATLPGVGTPSAKEVHYFDQKELRPSSWYFAHFWGSQGLLWGEASPEYFDTPDVPIRVQALLPDVKLIVSLRDPVARAVSHYHHSVDFGYEHRTLEEAVADELRLEAAGAWDSTMDRMRFGYLARSRYAGSLASWLELVPHERLLVVVAEERASSLERCASFLGLDLPSGMAPRTSNRRSYDEPSPELRAEIAAALVDDARELPALLGWDELPESWTVAR